MSETRPLEIRGVRQGYQLRESDDGGMPTLFGHFAVFNRWTEINSWSEGNFLERIVPGAFRKTMKENRSRIRALFQHGQDPQIGDKPLGPIEDLREDDTGGYYEVPLLDTQYNRELIPGLEAGLYGASFRFEVLRDEKDEQPEASEDNPRGLPERSVKEVRLHEFGPVTFPAYAEATADVRSLTDWFLFEQIARDPTRARELASLRAADFAPAEPDAGTPTSGNTRREPATWPKVTTEEWESMWSPKT
jgi:HK97 family phage prohead protease